MSSQNTNTNSGNSSSLLIPVSGESDLSSAGQLHLPSQNSHSVDFQLPRRCPCWPISYKIACIKSKGAILVLVLNFLVLTCVDGAYTILLPPILKRILQHEQPSVKYAWTITLVNIIRAVVYLFYPLAGWLADTFFGRYKTIVTSMWIVFLSTLTMTVLITLHYIFPEDAHYFHQYVFPFVFVLMTIGLAGFQANMIPFGTDQLQDAPGKELIAFVSWYVWTIYLSRGANLSYNFACVDVEHNLQVLVRSCAHAVCISLALALYFLFQHWLSKEPAGGNPLTTIFQVFNYARKHRYARFRSAFTYCEKEMPSRIDFAKMRYGGPFSTEQVEDVKTSYRMLTVFISLFVIITATSASSNTMGLLANHMSIEPKDLTFCVLDSVLDNLPLVFPVLAVPFFHFFVNPFIQNCWPASLKRIGIGALFYMAGILCAFMLDTIGHTYKPGNIQIPCLFSKNSGGHIPLDYRLIVLPSILSGLALPISDIAVYEFICAQTPHQMKGLLIGIFYCVIGLGFAFGFVLELPFYLQSSIHWPVSCGFWYYLINTLLLLVGFIVFCFTAKYYKQRTRDDPTYEQSRIEAYYERI